MCLCWGGRCVIIWTVTWFWVLLPWWKWRESELNTGNSENNKCHIFVHSLTLTLELIFSRGQKVPLSKHLWTWLWCTATCFSCWVAFTCYFMLQKRRKRWYLTSEPCMILSWVAIIQVGTQLSTVCAILADLICFWLHLCTVALCGDTS